MSGLTNQDIKVLESHVRAGNRELLATCACPEYLNLPISGMSIPSCWCLTLVLGITLSGTACARTPSPQQAAAPAATEIGRTINGHTYTNAPVKVTLGPNTFWIPANYLDSQIAPWPGDGVSLVIEWPDMKPTPPGARANPRTNDFHKEISVLIDYIDRVPIETSLERLSSNNAVTEEHSIERRNPKDRLDLRVAQPEHMGLIPYAIDQNLMDAYSRDYEARYGRPYTRNPAYQDDWYIARGAGGELTTFIKCDNTAFRKDGVRLEGDQVISIPKEVAADCDHYMSDVANSLSVRLSYKRAFLKDWKAMELAIRDVLTRTKVQ
jgi:hypothetical protein